MVFCGVFCLFFFVCFQSQRKITNICSDKAYQCSSTEAVLSAWLRGLHMKHCLLGQRDSTLWTWSLRKWSRNQRGRRREEQCQTPRSPSYTSCHCSPYIWFCGRALLCCGSKHKHGSAQGSCAGFDLSWGCKDTHAGLKWMGCDCTASVVHVPRALKGIGSVRNLCSESHFPQSEIFKEVKGLK